MSEYISIAEFAKRAGVSRQAIYARLDGDLSSFVQVDNGKKTLNIRALGLFSDKQSSQVDCSSPVKSLQDEIMLEMIKTLQTQLVEKDKQLEAAAAEKAALLERLKDAQESAQQAQQSAQQAQALHAGTMQQALIEARSTAEESGEVHKRGWKWWRR